MQKSTRCPWNAICGWSCLLTGLLLITFAQGTSATSTLVLSCDKSNRLYRMLLDNAVPCSRVDTVAEAVRIAAPGAGVLVLADGYLAYQTPPDEKPNMRPGSVACGCTSSSRRGSRG